MDIRILVAVIILLIVLAWIFLRDNYTVYPQTIVGKGKNLWNLPKSTELNTVKAKCNEDPNCKGFVKNVTGYFGKANTAMVSDPKGTWYQKA